MKLNRTRELWKATSPSGRWYYEIERQAAEDLATLFAEVDRLTAENARLREALERFHAAHDDAQSGMSPIVHTAPSQSCLLYTSPSPRD